MSAITKRLKSKNGNFSILFVIITFIAVLVVTAFLDILFESWTIQEVQSVMDVAGVSALRTGVDETKLRLGAFEVNRDLVESSFVRMVSDRLENAKKIKDFRFVRTEVKTFHENWGLGQAGRSRPQAMIDSTMVIVVENSPTFDLIPGTAKVFYDSRSRSNFEVSYSGRTQDGEIELIIRSVSRIVYR